MIKRPKVGSVSVEYLEAESLDMMSENQHSIPPCICDMIISYTFSKSNMRWEGVPPKTPRDQACLR